MSQELAPDPRFSFLHPIQTAYLEDLYSDYRKNPESIDATWRGFFDGMEFAASGSGLETGGALDPKELQVASLLLAYRDHGHALARTNPLEDPPSTHPSLDPARFGLDASDLQKNFHASKIAGLENGTLAQAIEKMRSLYCGTIGFDCSAVIRPEEKTWLAERFEALSRVVLSPDTKKRVFRRLSEAETLERFLHTRYVAMKRFSVEGGESLIPSLNAMIETASESGTKDVVLGMAHRGRLNVLVNVMGKKPKYLFVEFEDLVEPNLADGEGDVKYHMGYSSDVKTSADRSVHLSLAYNPSHLEFVDAVVGGMAKAKILLRNEGPKAVLPILIHGDAAFAGQGVVYETLTCSQLEGYGVGGTLHIILNNQVGFTTSPRDARSTPYSSDLGKFLAAPVLHVNGDDPEAVWKASALLTEYRMKFGRDAFLDLCCYRKHGHNEGDEPSFTQPLLYAKIKAQRSTREQYGDRLGREGVMDAAAQNSTIEALMEHFSKERDEAKAEKKKAPLQAFLGPWKEFPKTDGQKLFMPVASALPEERLKEISSKLNKIPADFHLHSKLGRFFEAREHAIQQGSGIDWGNAEALAYGTLLSEGVPIRLAGQDAERGTFTHRHAVLHDVETGAHYTPLATVAKPGTPFFIHNSYLSETGAMGFDYGWSLAYPKCLTIWEAQFGDFVNGAQVILDQFLSGRESKWNRSSGLTLLLPHGFEGQGPEHSSARLERFLQLSGRDNWFVCMPTTPAQIFHLLRRQALAPFRKPLVILSPKSLLRHPQAVSVLSELTNGLFQEVLDDPTGPKNPRKVLLCSGKVYYDLMAAREAKGAKDIAIVRIEQLYPFPAIRLAKVLASYSSAKEITWVQEEPRNMGSWTYIHGLWSGGTGNFGHTLGDRAIGYAGREIGASPAVGSAKLHAREQKALVEQALG